MKTETFIVLVSAEYSVREELDNALGHVWESTEHFLDKFCFDWKIRQENSPMPVIASLEKWGRKEVRFIPIHEFVDWWNDQDDHTEEFDKMNPTDSWMGYIQVKTQ